MEFEANANVLVVFTAVFLILCWWMQRRPWNLPPGPVSFPFVGSYPTFLWYKVKTGLEYHEILTELGKAYGKIYSLNMFGNYAIVISDVKLLKEALTNPSINDRHSNQMMKDLFGTNDAEYNDFQHYRRFAMTTFRHLGVGKQSFEEKVVSESEALLDVVAGMDGEVCELHELLNTATANVICAVTFGKRYRYDDGEFKHLMRIANRINDALGAGNSENGFPLYSLLPTKAKRETIAISQDIRIFLDKIIIAHRENFSSDCISDFLDAYINEQNLVGHNPGQNESFLTDDNMRGNLTSLFVAGADTVSNVVHWGILFMVTYPDIQNQVQSELDSVAGRQRFPRVSDKPELPYTKAVLQEIFRLASPVPLAVFHAVSKDTTIGPYSIPKGSSVVPNIWAIHRDPEMWSQPEEFRPERFMEGKDTHQDKVVIPFSVGRRSCPGEALAQTMVFIFFTHLLHRFRFEMPEGQSSPSLRGDLGIVYKPKSFQVGVVARDI